MTVGALRTQEGDMHAGGGGGGLGSSRRSIIPVEEKQCVFKGL